MTVVGPGVGMRWGDGVLRPFSFLGDPVGSIEGFSDFLVVFSRRKRTGPLEYFGDGLRRRLVLRRRRSRRRRRRRIIRKSIPYVTRRNNKTTVLSSELIACP